MTRKKKEKHGEPVWRNNIVGLTFEQPDQLMASPDNWRIHPMAQQEALRELLERIGLIAAVIQNDRTGHLIDGHARVEQALSTGQPLMPVLHVDLDEDDEREAIVTFDTIALMAGRDQAKHDALLEDVRQRTSAAVSRMLERASETRRWPQLRLEQDGGAHPHVGPRSPLGSSQSRARWTVMFRRDLGEAVRDALADLRGALGPDAELTWLEG